jgi:hypothetical protein
MMDVENMHPFCLPFSLCHDATSSSIMDSDFDEKQARHDETDKSTNNKEGKLRLKHTSSLVDDSLGHSDCSSTPKRSTINHDQLIENPISGDTHDAFDLLDLDIEMRTDGVYDIGSDDICNKNDDWFSDSTNHDCLLFSTPDSIISPLGSHRSSFKAHLKSSSIYPSFSSHNHQVFQHIVDPIDTKSSPTLAQLNLNSNEDPSDGLWDTTSTTATPSTTSTLISASAHHHHHHHHLNPLSNSDLLAPTPNCNSSTAASVGTGCSVGNFLSTCSHLNNYHQNHGTLTAEAATHHAAHMNGSHPCQHHAHQQPQNPIGSHLNSAYAHGACLAMSSLRNNATPNQRGNLPLVPHQGCCFNHHHHQHLDRLNVSSNVLAPSNASCQLDHKTSSRRFPVAHHGCNAAVESSLNKKHSPNVVDNHNQLQILQQQRCQSPAPLVTSSSSPLSSSASHNLMADNMAGGDNKLKENIEYLTVLLCNGSKKLENKTIQHPMPEQQQSAISSSIVKSYSTLAQSLSTGPKLLERYQQTDQAQQTHSQHHTTSLATDATQKNVAINQQMMTGKLMPQCAMQVEPQMSTNQTNLHDSKRVCPDHCFKTVNVESSVSAADSTAENQHSRPIDRSMGTCYAGQNATVIPNHMDSTQVSRSGGMKVLSSLLNSNKCTTQGASDPVVDLAQTTKDNYNQQQIPCSAWSPTCDQKNGRQATNVTNADLYSSESQISAHNGTYNHHDNSSIPVNGRPITLTPLVSNNVIIPLRQPSNNQHPASKSKVPTFIQPASPSTSSTTSSSGNTETAQSLSTFTKKQKSNTSTLVRNNDQSNQSVRQSSMSTDGSLSSHDEGFSSQIDQDDCGNSIHDSDDDSDIDSDDESFYGDYTNNDLIGASISDNPECKWTLNMGRTRRNGQRRFFWQYNVQSKGPKGTRICAADDAEDPFVLPEASDPVFSNECQVEGVKHSGKARRGDGNDLTPNPRKLLMIGLELKKLSKIINELAPVTDLPVNARNKTRKEKNKLASRACRLKKKAQHEANKIKLYGLQREHKQVVMAIFDARKMIHRSLTQQTSLGPSTDNQLSTSLAKLLDECLMTVAGQTGDYVNSVLEKVVSGCIDGGLQT